MTIRGFANSSSVPPLPSFSERDNRDSPSPSSPSKLRSFLMSSIAPRRELPSYFWAMSFRCQANNVTGVTMVATTASNFRPRRFALLANRRRLIIIQPQPLAVELFSKDPIFFEQVIDGILLLLIHPTGHGDDHKPEWVKTLFRFPVQSLLCIVKSGLQCPVFSVGFDFWTLRDRNLREPQ
jgi:hypothetical protein